MASSLGLNVVCAEYMGLEGGWPEKLKAREIWPLKSVEESWKGKSRRGFHQICLPTFLSDPWTMYVWNKLSRVSKDKSIWTEIGAVTQKILCNSSTDTVIPCLNKETIIMREKQQNLQRPQFNSHNVQDIILKTII